MARNASGKQIAIGIVSGVLLGFVIAVLSENVYTGVTTGIAGGVVITAALAGPPDRDDEDVDESDY